MNLTSEVPLLGSYHVFVAVDRFGNARIYDLSMSNFSLRKFGMAAISASANRNRYSETTVVLSFVTSRYF